MIAAARGDPPVLRVVALEHEQLGAEARHTVDEGSKALVGHALPMPSQTSVRSQTPPEARHTVPIARADQVVGPGAVAETIVHTWQLFAGFRSPLLKQAPPMRQKPSSVAPSQSLSTPSQTSGEGMPTVAVQTVPFCVELQTLTPVPAHAPMPAVHACPRPPPPVTAST